MIIFLGSDQQMYSDIIGHSRNDRDIVVSCQYRFLVPKSLIASHTCVNIHYGILPMYGGMSPVYWQLMLGDEAGVTLHYIDERFDTGDIIDIYRFPTCGKTADEVYAECRRGGKELLERRYQSIVDGTAPRTKQNPDARRYFSATDVDFSKTLVAEITDKSADRKVRALHFAGKQYPTIKLNETEYELRKKCSQSKE
jgi:methionyl-tRNA formyltransferase